MMHGFSAGIFASACFAALASTAHAQVVTNPMEVGGRGQVDVPFADIPVTLTLESRDDRVTAANAKGLVDVFNVAMHAECALFQQPCPSKVVLSIVGQAEFYCGSVDVQAACAFWDKTDTSIARIHFNADYLATTPAYDVVAHETMHLLQGSPYFTDCDYWKEGEADLARFYWGGDENHAASGFSLPEPGFAWQDILKDSAAGGAFLVWFHRNWQDSALVAFNAALVNGVCPGNDFWKMYTGFETFDLLWNAFAQGQDPGLQQPPDDGEGFEP